MDTFTGKMGCTLILSVKVSEKNTKGAFHKNKAMLTVYVNEDLIYVNFETICSFASKLTLCKHKILKSTCPGFLLLILWICKREPRICYLNILFLPNSNSEAKSYTNRRFNYSFNRLEGICCYKVWLKHWLR